MESDCKEPCQHNEYLYELSTDTASFAKAVNNCINNGGLLASDLHPKAYETINRCRAFSTGDYYIGLMVATDTRCMNRALGFQWLQSKNCTDGNPLEITKFRNNRQCVTIAQQTTLLPKANYRNWNTNRRYICQKKCIPSTMQSNKPTKMLSFETISSASYTINNDAAAFNAVLIPSVIGVVACIVLLALILLCFFLHKKGCLERFWNDNKLTALTKSELNDTRINPLYDG